MKKITLTEFWNSKEYLAIHCDTEEKANKLLNAFDKLGKKWNSGDSYISFNNYEDHQDKTCYSNEGCFDCYDWFNRYGYKIYEFDEVDLEN